ncbi:hypothetical protein O181_081942 [Austropuccinia psidii MF-1]|uniref:Sushi domain-containing protein n=1 Tax=Austropuccinia psidii MF-1 TaxID=1389203 RepID=A0A9Q3FPI5_9BASI|nr:hypothetical protein [Austropuccinia psidii MF-1]
MFATHLFLKRLKISITILAFQGLFWTSPIHQLAVNGDVSLPDTSKPTHGHGNPVKVVTCKRSYEAGHQLDYYTYCEIDNATEYLVMASSCYLRIGSERKISLKELQFPQCSKKGRAYAGAIATAFQEEPGAHKIIVTAGKIINSSDSIPTEGLTCAWSDLRPVCEIPNLP